MQDNIDKTRYNIFLFKIMLRKSPEANRLNDDEMIGI